MAGEMGVLRDRSIYVCQHGTIGCTEGGPRHKCWVTAEAQEILDKNGYRKKVVLFHHLRSWWRSLPAWELRRTTVGARRDRRAR